MASGSTIIGALPYPVSTDAPSVHTDIQALAQALANRLTSPTAHAASATLSDGELAVSTASPITLTLPSAAANAKVGVFAKVATAANPVTISSGSSNIYGLGLNGVSSLVLGSIGAFVVLQSDGTNWFVTDGQQDTGWVTLSLGTGMATHGGDTPAGRLVGDRVRLRGAIDQSGGSASSLATLPASMKPTVATLLPGVMFQSPNYAATLFTVSTSTGVLSSSNSGTAPISFYFDGCSYTLS